MSNATPLDPNDLPQLPGHILAVGTTLEVGNEIQIVKTDRHAWDEFGYNTVDLVAGDRYEIKQVSTFKVRITTERNDRWRGVVREQVWLGKQFILTGLPALPPLDYVPVPRKLGQPPAGDDIIAPDHPGLAWLWEDVRSLAKERNYCGQFDVFVEALGIPGEEKEYVRSRKIDRGAATLHLTVKVRARSDREADKLGQVELDKAIEALNLPEVAATE